LIFPRVLFPCENQGAIECAANHQEMLEMSIDILRGLAAERALLHHIDESWFEFEIAISDVHLWPSSDIATGWSQKVINALPTSHLCTFLWRWLSLKLVNNNSDVQP
jgi:hypothetical protein